MKYEVWQVLWREPVGSWDRNHEWGNVTWDVVRNSVSEDARLRRHSPGRRDRSILVSVLGKRTDRLQRLSPAVRRACGLCEELRGSRWRQQVSQGEAIQKQAEADNRALPARRKDRSSYSTGALRETCWASHVSEGKTARFMSHKDHSSYF